MKRHPLSVMLWLVALVVIVGLACGGPPATEEPSKKPVEQPVEQPAVEKEVEPEPDEPPAEVASVSNAVASIQDVRGAVIQIESHNYSFQPGIILRLAVVYRPETTSLLCQQRPFVLDGSALKQAVEEMRGIPVPIAHTEDR